MRVKWCLTAKKIWTVNPILTLAIYTYILQFHACLDMMCIRRRDSTVTIREFEMSVGVVNVSFCPDYDPFEHYRRFIQLLKAVKTVGSCMQRWYMQDNKIIS